MFVFGFNLPFGKAIRRPDGKEERPPHIIGLGVGWSRGDFTRVMKGPGKPKPQEREREG